MRRFSPKPSSDPGNTREGKGVQRTRKLLDDMAGFLASAMRIVSRGERTYFDPQDDTQRLAMSAIIINLSAASEKLPESVRAANPQIPWRDLKDTRNYLAHDYAGVDHRIIWNTAVKSFPELSGHVHDLRELF